MRLFRKIFKNPISIWFIRTLKASYQEIENYNLKIGYLSVCREVKFGKNVQIGNISILNKTQINDFSYVANNTNIFNCQIGKFVSIGSNCKIGVSSHPKNFISTHPFFYKKNFSPHFKFKKNLFEDYSKKISIGNDVWIGDDVMIMGGVKIGDGAIIGAKSLINKNIEPYSINAGIPSKVIGMRNKPKNEKWWDSDLESLINLRGE